jgi:hypothetical protein
MDIDDPVEMDTTIDTPAHTLGTRRGSETLHVLSVAAAKLRLHFLAAHPPANEMSGTVPGDHGSQWVASSPPTTPPGCLDDIEPLLLLLERQRAGTDQREIRSQATLNLMPVEPVSSMTNVKLYNEAGEETEEEGEEDNLELPQGLSSSCKDVVSCGAVDSKHHVGNWGSSEAELVSSTPFHRYGRASSTADTAAASNDSTASTTCVTHVASPPATPALLAASRAAVEASAPAVTLRYQTRWRRDCNSKPTKAQSYAVLALFFISISAIVLVSVLVSVFASEATGGNAGESSPAVTAGNDGGGGAQDVAANEGGDKGENGDKDGGRDGAPLSVPAPRLLTPSPQQRTPTSQPGQVFVSYQPQTGVKGSFIRVSERSAAAMPC